MNKSMCHGGISRGASETWATIDTAKLLTLLPIYDGLDVTVTSNLISSCGFAPTVAWFHVESIGYPSTESTP